MDAAATLAQAVLSRLGPGRRVVAIAGPPAAGKSTLAEALAGALNAAAPGTAAVLPLDGFHFDDLHLVPAGLRAVKGAPETFDVAGYAHALRRLRAAEAPFVAVPLFDRRLEIARAGARLIPHTVRVIVTEGNWLLLENPPWDGLAPLFDLTVALEVPEAVLERRLMARWREHGLPEDAARARVQGNDLPNARRVLAGARAADLALVWQEGGGGAGQGWHPAPGPG